MNRSAYTAIELVVVLAIASVVLSLTGPAVGRALSRSKSGQAAAALIEVHDLARDQALRRNPSGDGRRFGVRIWWDEDEAAYRIAMVSGSGASAGMVEAFVPGASPTTTADAARAMRCATLPPSIAVYVLRGGKPVELRDAESRELTWFFEPRTGFTTLPSGSGFTGPAQIGSEDRRIPLGTATQAREQLGAIGDIGADGRLSIPSLAAAAGGLPGLALAGTDGRNAVRIAVSPIGGAMSIPHEGRLK